MNISVFDKVINKKWEKKAWQIKVFKNQLIIRLWFGCCFLFLRLPSEGEQHYLRF